MVARPEAPAPARPSPPNFLRMGMKASGFLGIENKLASQFSDHPSELVFHDEFKALKAFGTLVASSLRMSASPAR
jgi:hypothetical protein